MGDNVDICIRRIVAEYGPDIATKRMVRRAYMERNGLSSLSSEERNAVNFCLEKIVQELMASCHQRTIKSGCSPSRSQCQSFTKSSERKNNNSPGEIFQNGGRDYSPSVRPTYETQTSSIAEDRLEEDGALTAHRYQGLHHSSNLSCDKNVSQLASNKLGTRDKYTNDERLREKLIKPLANRNVFENVVHKLRTTAFCHKAEGCGRKERGTRMRAKNNKCVKQVALMGKGGETQTCSLTDSASDHDIRQTSSLTDSASDHDIRQTSSLTDSASDHDIRQTSSLTDSASDHNIRVLKRPKKVLSAEAVRKAILDSDSESDLCYKKHTFVESDSDCDLPNEIQSPIELDSECDEGLLDDQVYRLASADKRGGVHEKESTPHLGNAKGVTIPRSGNSLLQLGNKHSLYLENESNVMKKKRTILVKWDSDSEFDERTVSELSFQKACAGNKRNAHKENIYNNNNKNDSSIEPLRKRRRILSVHSDSDDDVPRSASEYTDCHKIVRGCDSSSPILISDQDSDVEHWNVQKTPFFTDSDDDVPRSASEYTDCHKIVRGCDSSSAILISDQDSDVEHWNVQKTPFLAETDESTDSTGKQVRREAHQACDLKHDKELENLRRICRRIGLVLRKSVELRGCDSSLDKVHRIQTLLKERGMKGKPSMRNAEKFLLEKELKDLGGAANEENECRSLRSRSALKKKEAVEKNVKLMRNETAMFSDMCDIYTLDDSSD